MLGEDDVLVIICLAAIFQFFASFFSWKITVAMAIIMELATLACDPVAGFWGLIMYGLSILFYHWCPWADFRNKNSCKMWGGYAVKGRIVRKYDKGWNSRDGSSVTGIHYSNYHYVVEFLDCDGQVTQIDMRVPGILQWSEYKNIGGPDVIIVKICDQKKRLAIIDKAPSPDMLRKFQNGIFFGPMTTDLNPDSLHDNASRRARYGRNLPPMVFKG
ncbi:MAG: hypothetical protein MJZ61_04505 [Bacteroidales bacterium]|nr:hypothetical protein [Bacteroidales bacterium]